MSESLRKSVVLKIGLSDIVTYSFVSGSYFVTLPAWKFLNRISIFWSSGTSS